MGFLLWGLAYFQLSLLKVMETDLLGLAHCSFCSEFFTSRAWPVIIGRGKWLNNAFWLLRRFLICSGFIIILSSVLRLPSLIDVGGCM